MWGWGEARNDQDATVAVELEDRLQEQAVLITQLKDVIRQNEESIKSNVKELEETKAKFSKLKLQSKAKIIQLNNQLQEGQKKQIRDSNSPYRKEEDEDNSSEGSHSSHASDRSNRGKFILLKKQLDDSKLLTEKQEKELEQVKVELNGTIHDLHKQLADRERVITDLRSRNNSPAQNGQDGPQVQEMYAQIVYKDNKVLELNNRILELEANVMDLQENMNEKDQVIQSRNKAIQLMTEDLSRRGKNVVDQLDDTRDEMRQMQTNFAELENKWIDEKNELTKILKELEDKYNKDKAENNNRIAEHKEAMGKLESVRFDLSTRNAALQEKVVFLQQNLEKVTQVKNDSSAELNALKEKIKDKDAVINSLQMMTKEKNSKEVDTKAAVKIKAQYVGRIKALEKQLEAAQAKLSVDEKEKFESRIEQLEKEKEELRAELGNLHSPKDEKQAKMKELLDNFCQNHGSLETTINDVDERILSDRKKADELISQLCVKFDVPSVDELINAIDHWHEGRKILEVRVTSLQKDAEILQWQLQSVQNELDDLKLSAKMEKDQLNSQLKKSNEDVEVRQREIDSLQMELQDVYREKDGLVLSAREEIERLGVNHQEMAALVSRYQSVQTELDNLKLSHKEETKLLNLQMEKTSEESESRQKIIDLLQGKFDEVNNEKDDFISSNRGEIEHANIVVRERDEQLSVSQKEIEELRASLEKVQSELDGVNLSANEQTELLKLELEKAREEVGLRQNEIDLLRVKLDEIVNEKDDFISSAGGETERLNARIRELDVQLHAKEEKLEEELRNFQNVQTEFENLESSHNNALQSQLQMMENIKETSILLKQENDSLKESVSQFSVLFEEAKKISELELSKLNNDLATEKFKNDSLLTQMEQLQFERDNLMSAGSNETKYLNAQIVKTGNALVEKEQEISDLKLSLENESQTLLNERLTFEKEREALDEKLQKTVEELEFVTVEKKKMCDEVNNRISELDLEFKKNMKSKLVEKNEEVTEIQRKLGESCEKEEKLKQKILELEEEKDVGKKANDESMMAMTEKLGILEATIAELEKSLSEKEKLAIEIRRESEELLKEKNEIQNQWQKMQIALELALKNQMRESVENNSSLQEDLKDIQEALVKKKLQCEELKSEMKEVEEKMTTVEKDAMEKDSEIQKLLSVVKETKSISMSLEEENIRTQQEVVELQSQLLKEGEEMKSLRENVVEIQREFDVKSERVSELENEIQRHLVIEAELKETVECGQNGLQKAVDEFDEFKRKQIEIHEARGEEIVYQMRRIEEEKLSLEKELSETSNRLRSFEVKCVEQEKSLVEMEKGKSEINGEKTQLSDKVNKLTAYVEQLEEDLKNTAEALEESGSKEKILEVEKTELTSTYEARIAELSKFYTDLTDEYKKLESQTILISSNHEELSKRLFQVDVDSEEIEKLRFKINEMSDEIKKKSEENNSLNTEYEKQCGENENLSGKLNVLMTELSAMREKNDKLDKKIEELDREMLEKQDKVEMQAEMIDNANILIERMKEDHQNATEASKQELQKLMKRDLESEKKLENVTEENVQLITNIQSLEKEVIDLQRIKDELNYIIHTKTSDDDKILKEKAMNILLQHFSHNLDPNVFVSEDFTQNLHEYELRKVNQPKLSEIDELSEENERLRVEMEELKEQLRHAVDKTDKMTFKDAPLLGEDENGNSEENIDKTNLHDKKVDFKSSMKRDDIEHEFIVAEMERLVQENEELKAEIEILRDKLSEFVMKSDVMVKTRSHQLGESEESDRILIEKDEKINELAQMLIKKDEDENVQSEKKTEERREKEITDSVRILEGDWDDGSSGWGWEGEDDKVINQSEVKKTEEKIEDLMEENVRLKQELEEMKIKLSQMIGKVDKMEKTFSPDLGQGDGGEFYAELEEKHRQIEKELKECRDELEVRCKENLEMMDSIVKSEELGVKLTAEKEMVLQELGVVREKNEKLEKRVVELGEVIEEMNRSFEEEKMSWTEEVESNRSQVETLGMQLTTVKMEKENLVMRSVKEVEDANSSVQEELEVVKSKNAKMLGKLKQFKEKNDRITQENSAMVEEMKNLHEEVKRLQRDNGALQDQLMKFTDQVDKLEISNSSLIQVKDLLEKEIEKQRVKCAQLTERNNSLGGEINKFKEMNERCVREMQDAKDQTEILISDNNTFQNVVENLKHNKTRVEEEMRQQATKFYHLNEEKEKLRIELSNFKDVSDKYEVVLRINQENEEKCSRFEKELTLVNDKLNVTNSENDSLRRDKISLELRLEEQNDGQRITELEEVLKENEERRKEMEVELSNLKESDVKKQSQIEEAKSELSKLQAEIEKLLFTLKKVQTECGEERKNLIDMGNENKELRNEFENELKVITKLSEDQGRLIDGANAEKAELIEKLESSRVEIERLRENCAREARESKMKDSLLRNDKASEATVARLTADLEQVSHFLHQREYQCKNLTEELAQMIDERDLLQSRLSNLRMSKQQNEFEIENLQRQLEDERTSFVNNDVKVNVEDIQPLIIPETSYTLTRTVRGTTWRLQNWIQGRKKYMNRLYKTKLSVKMLYYAYIITIHILLLVSAFT